MHLKLIIEMKKTIGIRASIEWGIHSNNGQILTRKLVVTQLDIKKIVGKFGDGPRNEEGEHLLKLFNKNYWVIGNTWFQKIKSH